MAKGSTTRGRPGRKPALNAQHIRALRSITRGQPRSSLDEVTRELQRRAGVEVCSATVRKALRQAGISRLKPQRKPGERAAIERSLLAEIEAKCAISCDVAQGRAMRLSSATTASMACSIPRFRSIGFMPPAR